MSCSHKRSKMAFSKNATKWCTHTGIKYQALSDKVPPLQCALTFRKNKSIRAHSPRHVWTCSWPLAFPHSSPPSLHLHLRRLRSVYRSVTVCFFTHVVSKASTVPTSCSQNYDLKHPSLALLHHHPHPHHHGLLDVIQVVTSGSW